MEKKIRLRSNRDYQKVYAAGKAFRNRNFVLIIRPNGLAHARIGFSITKKMGNSVTRNRLKRRLREMVRQNLQAFAPRADIIVIPRKNTLSMPYAKVEQSLLHVLALAKKRKKMEK